MDFKPELPMTAVSGNDDGTYRPYPTSPVRQGALLLGCGSLEIIFGISMLVLAIISRGGALNILLPLGLSVGIYCMTIRPYLIFFARKRYFSGGTDRAKDLIEQLEATMAKVRLYGPSGPGPVRTWTGLAQMGTNPAVLTNFTF